MDGEAGWWTTSGNIGLPPLARDMGVGRKQHMLSGVAALDIFRDLSFFMTSSFCMAMVVSVSSTYLGSKVGVSVSSSFGGNAYLMCLLSVRLL